MRHMLAVLGMIVIAAAALGLSTPTPAQDDAGSETRAREATADRLARGALLMLRGTKPPLPVDFQLCAEQLRLALKLDPNNPYILRRMREALYRAGDIEGFEEATRRLSVLEPEDTVLQLAVISGRIASIQNADDRLAAYERLLSPAGDSIDDSVRSRLAFDAALLAQEQGDQDRFVALLTRAAQLDSTNKQAAARVADYLMAFETDPKGRIDILANVVLADPLDPSAHMNLAREFLRNGATHAGERFLNHAVALWQMQGFQQDEGTLLQRYALQWLHKGPDSVLDDLDEMESIRRYDIEQQRKALEEAGEDPEEAGEFKQDPLIERIRLIIASESGQDELAKRSLLNIEKGIHDAILNAQKLLESEDPPNAREIDRLVSDLLVQSVYLRLWSGGQIDKAEATIDQLVKLPEAHGVRPEAIERFRGWVAARRGDRDTAERLLEPQAQEEPFAMLGLGVAAESADDLRGAVRAYAKAALAEPGSLLGVWARKRVERLLGSTISQTPKAQELERLAESLPETIDRMVKGPGAFLNVYSAPVSEELDRLGRALVRISVRNVGPIPVAVGERAPCRTSTLLIPRLALGGVWIAEAAEPEVISLNRRLRLMPRETMEFVVWADQGQTGALLDLDAELPATLRWRTVIGFEIDQYGQYALGGTSLEHECGLATRGRLKGLGDNIEDVTLSIELAETGEPLLLALLQARAMLMRTLGSESPDIVDIRNNICDAIATRFETMTQAERAFTLVMLPRRQAIPDTMVIDALAKKQDDPMLNALLLRRVTDPDDALFSRIIESDDPEMSKLARLLQIRLKRLDSLTQENNADDG